MQRMRLAGAVFIVTALLPGTAGVGTFTLNAAAAGPPPASAGQPLVTPEAHHDTSPPLAGIPPTTTKGHTQNPRPGPGGIKQGKPSQDTSGLPRNGAKPVSGGGSGGIPGSGAGFEGIGNNGHVPPDNEVAAGPTQVIEVVNTQLAVYNKAGRALVGPENTNTLWSGFGGTCQTTNDGDATVLFDTMAQRWVLQQFSATSPYLICVAVSSSSDAQGTWHRYSFPYSNFPDYPKMGIWPDAYYLSANLFTSSSGGSPVGSEVCAYNRANMLSGAAATQQCFFPSSGSTLLPASMDGSNQPAAGTPEWFLALWDSTHLAYWKFHVDWVTPTSSTFSAASTLAVNSYAQACFSTCVPQPNTTQQLDALGDRLMYRLAYRNFGDHESLVVTHTVVAGGGNVAPRWYELRPSAGALTVFQQGTYAPDGSNRWFGSIAMDHVGDMGLGYTLDSSTVYPSVDYTGRLVSDTPGSMPQGETAIITGSGSQVDTTPTSSCFTPPCAQRWGDYSEMSVDPVDDCTFWYSNEYLTGTGIFNWHTRIGSFRFLNCNRPNPYSYTGSWNSQPVVLASAREMTVEGLPDNTFVGSISNFQTNDPSQTCLNGESISLFTAPAEYPDSYVAHNGLEGPQCVYRTWTFPLTYYTATWSGTLTQLTNVPSVTVEGLPDNTLVGTISNFQTNDSSQSCLNGETINVFTAPAEYPGVYVAHNGLQGSQCAYRTWTFAPTYTGTWNGTLRGLTKIPSVTVEGLPDSTFVGTIGNFQTSDLTQNCLDGETINVFTAPAEYPGVYVAHNGLQGTQCVYGTWTFPPDAPTVTGVSPSSGSNLGGQSVTISGTNLTFAGTVLFGGIPATSVSVGSDSSVTAVTPAHAVGTIDVQVVTSVGASGTSSSDHYTYMGPPPVVSSVSPTFGIDTGGTSVTISGSAFTGASAVTFGGTNATSFSVNSDSTISATTPSHADGTVDVQVTAHTFTSNISAADRFTFGPRPAVSSASPTRGWDGGGQTVTISGSGFTGATAVTFGGTNATSFSVNSDSTITATTPSHADGVVDIQVTANGVTSNLTGGDHFTFAPRPVVTGVSPPIGLTLLSESVTITGSGFTAATAVTFGSASASYTVVSDTQIIASSPIIGALSIGPVDVRVTAAGVTSFTSTSDLFIYL